LADDILELAIQHYRFATDLDEKNPTVHLISYHVLSYLMISCTHELIGSMDVWM